MQATSGGWGDGLVGYGGGEPVAARGVDIGDSLSKLEVTLMCRRVVCLSSPFDATAVVHEEQARSGGLDFED